MTRRTKRAAEAGGSNGLAKLATRRDAKAKAAPSDTKLIKECVAYAQSIAALNGGFTADPDGDSKHAAAAGARHSTRAWQALTKITSMPATTAAGLQAKARMVPLLIDDNRRLLDEAGEAFLLAFAAEVKAFLGPLVHASWSTAKDAAKARAA